MLPPALDRVADELAQGAYLSLESEAQLAATAPVLYEFVKGTGGSQEERRHMATFIRQLHQVSSASQERRLATTM